jgi:hypothetical protein
MPVEEADGISILEVVDSPESNATDVSSVQVNVPDSLSEFSPSTASSTEQSDSSDEVINHLEPHISLDMFADLAGEFISLKAQMAAPKVLHFESASGLNHAAPTDDDDENKVDHRMCEIL